MKDTNLPKLSKQGSQILVNGDVDIESKKISDDEALQVSLVTFLNGDVIEKTLDVKVIDNISMKHIDTILFRIGALQEAMNLISARKKVMIVVDGKEVVKTEIVDGKEIEVTEPDDEKVTQGMILLVENRDAVEAICSKFTNISPLDCSELDASSLIQIFAKIVSTPAVAKLLEYYAKKNGANGDVKKKR